MAPVTLVPPAALLAVAGYGAFLLRRYPNEWPRGFEMLPFRGTRRNRWVVAVLGLVAGPATAAFTLALTVQRS